MLWVHAHVSVMQERLVRRSELGGAGATVGSAVAGAEPGTPQHSGCSPGMAQQVTSQVHTSFVVPATSKRYNPQGGASGSNKDMLLKQVSQYASTVSVK